jgi:hypothetical protein
VPEVWKITRGAQVAFRQALFAQLLVVLLAPLLLVLLRLVELVLGARAVGVSLVTRVLTLGRPSAHRNEPDHEERDRDEHEDQDREHVPTLRVTRVARRGPTRNTHLRGDLCAG